MCYPRRGEENEERRMLYQVGNIVTVGPLTPWNSLRGIVVAASPGPPREVHCEEENAALE